MMRPTSSTLRDKFDASLELRVASPEDLDGLLDIAASAHHAPWSRGVFEKEFTVDFSQTWGAFNEHDKLVGSLVFWRVHDELHVLDVAVHKSAQGRGIGAKLMEALIAFGRAQDMLLITLEVRAGNLPAIGLYEKCGFETVGLRKKYYADNGDDAIIMTRILA